MTRIALLLVVCFSFTAEVAVNAAVPANSKKAPTTATRPAETTTTTRVRLIYGSEWEAVPSKQLPPRTLAMLSRSGVKGAGISVKMVGPIAATLTLKQMMPGALAEIKQRVHDFKLIEETTTTLDGQPATRLLYDASNAGEPQRLLQYFTIKQQAFFIITFSMPRAGFDGLKAAAEQVIETFKVGGPALGAGQTTTRPATTSPAAPVEWVAYQPEEGGYAISFPEDWEAKRRPSQQVSVLFRELGEPVGNRVSVITLTPALPVPAALGVEEIGRAIGAQSAKDMPDAKVRHEAAVTIGGHPGWETIVDGTPAGQPRVTMSRDLVIIEGQGYVFALSTAPESYDRIRPVYDKILASFKVLPKVKSK